MSDTDREIRLLRQLVRDLRDEPVPELDGERMERDLLARLAQEPRALRGPHGGVLARVVATAVAAAAIVLLASTQGPIAPRPGTPMGAGTVDVAGTVPLAPQAEGEAPSHLASALPLGGLLVSGDEALRFAVPRVVTWSLAPGSRARVTRMSSPHTVALERGTVRAEVVPRHDTNALVETFAVEAEGTRVAVHGTELAVSLEDGLVTVEVFRGTVAVGRAGQRGVTTGQLLVGPMRAVFAADSAQLVGMLQPTPPPVASLLGPEAVATGPSAGANGAADDRDARSDAASGERAREHAPSATGSTPTSPPATPDDPSAPAATPAAPTPADTAAGTTGPKLALAEARSLLLGCIASALGASGSANVQVAIASTVTLNLDGDGFVRSLRFSPPLRPDLQQSCAGLLFGRALAVSGTTATLRIDYAPR